MALNRAKHFPLPRVNYRKPTTAHKRPSTFSNPPSQQTQACDTHIIGVVRYQRVSLFLVRRYSIHTHTSMRTHVRLAQRAVVAACLHRLVQLTHKLYTYIRVITRVELSCSAQRKSSSSSRQCIYAARHRRRDKIT